MSVKLVTGADFAQAQLLNAALQNLASAPSSPVAGQTYYDTTLNHSRVWNGSGWEQASGASGSGSVTTVSVVSANGLAGTVANATSTPAITLTTTVTGLLKGNGTAISAAASGTDYAPATATTSALKGNGSGGFAAATLNDVGAATADYSLNSHRITSLLDPTSAQDAATKNYVDATIQGIDVKPSANYATTAALPTCTYANGTSGAGATLTATANAALASQDGQSPAANDLFLVKNQASASQNGLYVVTQVGSGSLPFILTRSTSMDVSAEYGGALIAVENGTTNGGSLWLCTTNAPTVGTTAIAFTELNKATDLAAGSGITITGNSIAVSASYTGSTSITTLGTITAGTWTGTAIAVLNGGTGATTAAGARTNLGATGKYSALVGDGTSTSISITQGTHGLASNGQLHAQLFDATTGAWVICDTTINNGNGTVTFGFNAAPASNAYRCVIIG